MTYLLAGRGGEQLGCMEQSVTGAKIGIGHDRFPVAFRFFVIELGQQLNDGKGLGVFRGAGVKHAGSVERVFLSFGPYQSGSISRHAVLSLGYRGDANAA
ncbi:hypothetical protein [Pseudomonas aeruginosa]|uniref:hypothetical protein n=1 Tax=Pseudomonas aeruginosa TaxID=287 RepID=UPI000F549CE4|nr:hypothetical protein [Pseudomonas aeruginosa]WCW05347.1 hypothetical protein KK222_15880 [Pseudomonas aeruginosa]